MPQSSENAVHFPLSIALDNRAARTVTVQGAASPRHLAKLDVAVTRLLHDRESGGGGRGGAVHR